MIKKLVLENYRLYKDYTVEFDSKLNVIRGANGIGKTSIVEAIGFALFGSSMQRGKAGSWVRQGSSYGAVKLFIDDYIVTRTSNLAIIEDLNGNILARNNTGISEWVFNHYGLTVDLYRTSYYIGQKDIGSFAALSPLERTKRVEKLLRIDKLDDIKQAAREKLKAIDYVITNARNTLENNPFEESLLAKEYEHKKELEGIIQTLKEEYSKLLIAQGEYNQQLKQWEHYTRLKRQFKGVTYDIETLKKVHKKNQEKEEYNRLVDEKANLEKKLANVTILKKYFNSDISLHMNHKNILMKRNQIENKLKELKVEPVKHDLDLLIKQIGTLEQKIALLEKIPDVCPTCGQDWPEKPAEDLNALKIELQNLREDYSLKQREQRAFELTRELKTLNIDFDANEIDIAIDSVRYQSDYERLEKLSDIGSTYRDYEQVISLEKALEQNNLSKQLDELGEVEKPEPVDIQGTRTLLDKQETQLQRVTYNINKMEQAKAIQEEHKKILEENLETYDKLKEFIKFIDSYRKSFGNNVIPLLNHTVSNIVAYLTENKYTEIVINPDYSIDQFDFYSGSEQDAISFALRLAIAKISRLGTFNTILLDEIAASFDSNKEQLLLDILKQQNMQLIYITHGDI